MKILAKTIGKGGWNGNTDLDVEAAVIKDVKGVHLPIGIGLRFRYFSCKKGKKILLREVWLTEPLDIIAYRNALDKIIENLKTSPEL